MPPGYYDRVVSRGVIEGEFLVLTREAHAELQAEYSQGVFQRQLQGCKGCGE